MFCFFYMSMNFNLYVHARNFIPKNFRFLGFFQKETQIKSSMSLSNAALTYTEYPLRIFALKLPNMMRMDGAGLVQNDVFAKALRECLRILTNFLRMLRLIAMLTTEFLKMPYECFERLQMPLQIIRTSCKHLTNEANV